MPDDSAAELESLLSEYDESAGAPEPTPNAEIGKLAKTIQPVVDYVNEDRAQKQKAQFDTDVKDIVGFLSKGEGLKELPDKLKRGFLEVHAQDNAEFGLAFDNKAKNPKAWEAAKEKARDSLKEVASRIPGSKGRTHAGRPGSDDGISPVQKMKMSDFEWRVYLDEKHDR